MKKLYFQLGVVLAVTASIAALSGCNKNEESGANETTPPPAANPANPASASGSGAGGGAKVQAATVNTVETRSQPVPAAQPGVSSGLTPE